nr:c-type cytochrome [Anaerolineae bacterium]
FLSTTPCAQLVWCKPLTSAVQSAFALIIIEGGVLTNTQIDQMVILIQSGDWQQVGQRVAELGLTPPTAAVVEVPEELLQTVLALEGGETLAAGLTLYAENCAACHGTNLEGTALAPSLTSVELLASTDTEIERIITQGMPGTLMAGWGNTLTPDEIAQVIGLIRRWSDLQESGIELPAIEVPVVAATPEMIAEGAQLYTIACKACHGVDALGSPMAPALNSQQSLAETPDAAIYQIIAQGVPGTLMPAWGGRLSDNDLNAIVAYLRSLEAAAPLINQPSTPAPGQAPAGGAGPPWLRNP